jgi:hypothetical protein
MGISPSNLSDQSNGSFDFCYCLKREESSRQERQIRKAKVRNLTKDNSLMLVPSLNGSFSDSSAQFSNQISPDETKRRFLKIATDSSHRDSSQSSARSSWCKPPDPLPDWTWEEQSQFIRILEENPRASRNQSEDRRKLYAKARVVLPNKSYDDFRACLTHVQSSRVAYFGIKR